MDLLYILSVLCCLGAVVVVAVVGVRLRNWRLGLLILLMGGLAYHQGETLAITLRQEGGHFSWAVNAARLWPAVPGLVFSLLTLFAAHSLAQLLLSRERSRAGLQRSEELNRRLVEALPGGYLQVDAEGHLVRWNAEAAFLLDLPDNEAGLAEVSDVTDSVIREDGMTCLENDHPLMRCLATGEMQPSVTLGKVTKEARIHWGVFRAVPLPESAHHKARGALLILLDVTQRKRAENLIRGRNRVLQLIAEGRELLPVLTALVGTIGEQIPGSIGLVSLLNQAGTRLSLVVAPRLPMTFRAVEDGLLVGPLAGTSGTAAYTRERVIDADISQSERWEQAAHAALAHGLRACWAEPILGSDQQLLGTLTVYFKAARTASEEEVSLLEDATQVAGIAIERHRTEEALHRSEADLARTESFALVIPLQVNLDGSWRKLTPTFADLVGYGRTELMRMRFLELVHPEDRDTVRSLTDRLLSGELRSMDTEARLLRKDGFLVWAYLNASLVSDDQGRPVFFLTYIRDVTAKKRAEQALRDSEQRLKLAMEAARLGSWDWDIKHNKIIWARETEAMFGLAPGAFVGTFEAYLGHVHPEDRGLILSTVDRSLGDLKDLHIEHRVFNDAGEIRWLEVWGKTMLDSLGEPVRMLGTMTDITERKNADLELEQARQRLRSLSHELLQVQESERRQIAQELHGEVGNALTIIRANLQVVCRSLNAKPHLARLQECIEQSERVAQQVRELSLTLRPPLLDDLGLEAALRWYVDQQTQDGALIPRIVVENLDQRLDPTIETACFRVAQEAIRNVVLHAAADRMTVELRCTAGHLHLIVRDDGRGFDVASARSQSAQGRSVGLLGMEERVAVAGGRFECLSRPQQGTEVSACFPLTTPSRLQRRRPPRFPPKR